MAGEQLRLAPCQINDLEAGDEYVEYGAFIMRKSFPASPDYTVLAVMPAEPPIDRARVLALLRRISVHWIVPADMRVELEAVVAMLEGGA